MNYIGKIIKKLGRNQLKWWSVHPSHLNKAHLLSAWREGLQIQNSLQKGDKNSLQIDCFNQSQEPIKAIGAYLSFLASEGCKRGYNFSHEKIIYPNFAENFVAIDNRCFDKDYDELQKKSAWQNAQSKIRQKNPVFCVIY